MLFVLLIKANDFRDVTPMASSRLLGNNKSKEAFGRGWLSWARPAERLHYDQSRDHLGGQGAELGEPHGALMVPVPLHA